jgi:hypothetical protein
MAYKLSKGNNSTRYDHQINQVEKIYPTERKAIIALNGACGKNLRYVTLPNGAKWAYDTNMAPRIIDDDIYGHRILAKIEEC